jgi:monofunctional chorismate mutase
MDIDKMRADIDRMDAQIIELLKKRFEKAGEIGREKKMSGTGIVDRKREEDVLENYKRLGGGELDESFIEELVELLLEHSREVQR